MRTAGLALLASLGLGAALSGCAGANGPAFRPEVVDPAKAIVYVYRPPRHWAGDPVAVYLDQRFLGRLAAGQYLSCTVDPGQRLIRAEGESDAVREVHLQAGDSAFFEVHSSSWDGRPDIEVPDEAAARARIAQTGKVDAAR